MPVCTASASFSASLATVTRSVLEEQIIELAHYHGWRVAHFRPARTEKGWRTPVSADGKGFPDLVLLRDKRMLVIECKGFRGYPSKDQRAWLEAFRKIPCISVMVVRPALTMDAVEKLLA